MWPWIVSESSESQSLDQKVQRAKKYNKAHVYLWKREKEYQRETRCINLSKKQKFIWEIKYVSTIRFLVSWESQNFSYVSSEHSDDRAVPNNRA